MMWSRLHRQNAILEVIDDKQCFVSRFVLAADHKALLDVDLEVSLLLDGVNDLIVSTGMCPFRRRPQLLRYPNTQISRFNA